ncbi:hypothetical protein [Streptomyces griseus]|uniref:hypothetical protein n=1 Tax=Streptomyces griseus TaxID=1911 RepID=UPI000D1BFE73|nr:hypothetical protein [Streptomyces griseus]
MSSTVTPLSARAPSGSRSVAHHSPLKHADLSVLRRDDLTAGLPAAGALRPPHDPDSVELDEDDAGGGQE